MRDITTIKYTPQEIAKKRRQIAKSFVLNSPNVKSADIKQISDRDLRLLFELYDQVFFDGWFRECFPGTLKLSFSRRMTKSAGKTLYPKNADPSRPEGLVVEVRISVDFILGYGALAEANKVGGIPTKSSLEALQIILEHELIHVIEFFYFQQSSCKKERFQTMAHSLFGHTESCHRLATNQQIARQKLGFAIGDTVSFSCGGKRLEGVVHGIRKRATVMVRDEKGSFTDQHGNRYAKYYVPLELLQAVPIVEGQ